MKKNTLKLITYKNTLVKISNFSYIGILIILLQNAINAYTYIISYGQALSSGTFPLMRKKLLPDYINHRKYLLQAFLFYPKYKDANLIFFLKLHFY